MLCPDQAEVLVVAEGRRLESGGFHGVLCVLGCGPMVTATLGNQGPHGCDLEGLNGKKCGVRILKHHQCFIVQCV